MGRLLINEGASGIVELLGPGIRENYFPNNDLDQALSLLFELYELKAANGLRFLDNYHEGGINWLSGQVGNIYWRYLFRHVQYAPLIARLESEGLKPHFADKVNLARIWELLHPIRRTRVKDLLYYRGLLPRHNRRVVARGMDFLFYRYGPKDFRTRDILEIFEKRGLDFHFVYSPSATMYRKRRRQPHPVYFLHRDTGFPPRFLNEYDLSGLDEAKARLFQAVIRRVEANMSFQMHSYERHLADLRAARPRLLFGLDDHQEIHPLLYACRELGVPTIGYQFSMYARRQAAYVLERWEPDSYSGFDHVIVWGDYWEDKVRKYSDAHPEGYFLPGSNKHRYGYRRLESERFDTRNILIPYEFWGNTRRIGEYMVKLMDLGFRVYFKFKPDERPERQLECYRLPPEYAARLVQVFDISDELMAEINIVAGGMTTLLYDLLPYGKHTWVLETEFRLLEDMVEDGLARKVDMEDLEALAEPGRADHRMDYGYIFNDISLEHAVEQQVLSRL
jgi:hypothetical protein